MQLHHSNFRRYRKAYRVESPFPWASNYLLLLVIDGLLLYLLVYLSWNISCICVVVYKYVYSSSPFKNKVHHTDFSAFTFFTSQHMLEVIPPLFVWSFPILFYSCNIPLYALHRAYHNLFNQLWIESLVKNEEKLQPSVISHSPSSHVPFPSFFLHLDSSNNVAMRATLNLDLSCVLCLTSFSTEIVLVLVTKFNDYFFDFIQLEFSWAMLITCPLLFPNTMQADFSELRMQLPI